MAGLLLAGEEGSLFPPFGIVKYSPSLPVGFAVDTEWFVGRVREHLAGPPNSILARFPFINFHRTCMRVIGCLEGSGEGMEAENAQGDWRLRRAQKPVILQSLVVGDLGLLKTWR